MNDFFDDDFWEEEESGPDAVEEYWREQFAKEAAEDQHGALPKRFLIMSIAQLQQGIEKRKSYFGNHDLINERDQRWIQSLKDHYKEHYE